MTLTKYEKETIIPFNEGEDTAHIQTYNAGLRKRLAEFSKKRPRPLSLGKILRPGRRDLCTGQVQTFCPTASTVQRGTQTESQRLCQEARLPEQDGKRIGKGTVKAAGSAPLPWL